MQMISVKEDHDVNYTNNLALLTDNNTNAQKLLHIPEESAVMIGLHAKTSKTQYISFHQTGSIETLDRTPLKQIDDFE